ncbi:MAG: right-handed parallel beta-helix repeat-containing protein [Actinomycetota bacterium]|nr:right-handed parallel beta-helix repeat-containing protein [Actinomycetota bacterium]
MFKRLKRIAAGVPAVVLLAGTAIAITPGQASALTHVNCGAVIHASITLANDVGPCTGDGIDLTGSNYTVHLNGHTITGSNGTNNTNNQQLGINLMNAHKVTVFGDAVAGHPGTITAFDAGVGINGGGSNTIVGITVRDNISHVLLTGGVDPTNPVATACDFGDGITLFNSNGNLIQSNNAVHNGPFSGISLVGTSSHNTLDSNISANNTISNLEPDGATSGPCGPFQSVGAGPGRAHQDVGIRVEGPGAMHNVVKGNSATGNQLEGIAIHGNVCMNNPNPAPENDYNKVLNNFVSGNGFAGPNENLDGIGILSQGPSSVVCVAQANLIQGNTSSNNAGNGVYVGGRNASLNQVIGNTVNSNGAAGVYISSGALEDTIKHNTGSGNGTFDGFDGNPGCGIDQWKANVFVTVNQPCVK